MIPLDSDALAIDPGYAGQGNACARGVCGVLVSACFEKATGWFFDERPLQHVIIEQPQQDGRSWAVPPGILIKLAFEGATLAGFYAGATGADLHTPTVSEWKGSEKKPSHHKRLLAMLRPSEIKVLGGDKTIKAVHAACEKGALDRWSRPGVQYYPKSFTTHNLLDAAALLMWAYGRLEKVG